MENSKRYKRHVKNVQRETSNPVILNDVVSSEIGQHPGHTQQRAPNSNLTQVQEVSRDSIDGKTWQNMDES